MNLVECYVEKWLYNTVIEEANKFEILKNHPINLKVFDSKDEDLKKTIKFLITLGGDGTILYAAKTFHGDYVPPMITFSLVSLILVRPTIGIVRLSL